MCTRRVKHSQSTSRPGSVEHGVDSAVLLIRLEELTKRYISECISLQNRGRERLHRHRDAFAAAVAHGLVRENCTASLRDLYYMAPGLYGRQENSNAALKRVALSVPSHRNNLNILASPKGLVAGNLLFLSESRKTVNVALFGAAGISIPARPERLANIHTSADCILVVEKETVWQSLATLPNFLEDKSCLLVTGKGYPDFATRLLLQEICKSREHTIPVLVLTDADPHGLCIALTYAACVHEACYVYIGIRPSDRLNSLKSIPQKALMPLTASDRAITDNAVARESLSHGPTDRRAATCGRAAILKEFKFLLESNIKFEIEALVTLEMSPLALVKYIDSKVEELSL